MGERMDGRQDKAKKRWRILGSSEQQTAQRSRAEQWWGKEIEVGQANGQQPGDAHRRSDRSLSCCSHLIALRGGYFVSVLDKPAGAF